jgi:hypothetical protein
VRLESGKGEGTHGWDIGEFATFIEGHIMFTSRGVSRLYFECLIYVNRFDVILIRDHLQIGLLLHPQTQLSHNALGRRRPQITALPRLPSLTFGRTSGGRAKSGGDGRDGRTQ